MNFEKGFNEQSEEQIKIEKIKKGLIEKINGFKMKNLDAIRSRIALNQDENLENDPEKLRILINDYIEKEMKTSLDADFFVKLVEASEEYGRLDGVSGGDEDENDLHDTE